MKTFLDFLKCGVLLMLQLKMPENTTQSPFFNKNSIVNNQNNSLQCH